MLAFKPARGNLNKMELFYIPTSEKNSIDVLINLACEKKSSNYDLTVFLQRFSIFKLQIERSVHGTIVRSKNTRAYELLDKSHLIVA